MKRSLSLLLAWFSVLAVFELGACGGGGDCNSICTDSLDCPDNQGQKIDCSSACTSAQKLADDAKCDKEWSALVDCVGGLDACTEASSCKVMAGDGSNSTESCTGPCGKQEEAYDACLKSFCSDKTHESECEAGLL